MNVLQKALLSLVLNASKDTVEKTLRMYGVNFFKTIFIEGDWELIVIKNEEKEASVFIMHSFCKRLSLDYCAKCQAPTTESIRKKRDSMEKIINFPC